MRTPAELVPTQRVKLRRWQEADQHELHQVVIDALTHLKPWMPWATEDYDLAAAAAFLTQSTANWDAGTSYAYAITFDERIIGSCGLERRIGAGGLEIGYWLHPDATGAGLATEAAAALVDEAFTLDGIERVQIKHDIANTASGAIPPRLGFSQVGREPRETQTSGEAGLHLVWELTRIAHTQRSTTASQAQ